jgi:drug/metabolite transporter (DMT)-like permease
MYHFFLGITFLQQFRPYFRKHISNTLDPHEYMLLNAITIMIIIMLYISYLCITQKTTHSKLISNIQSLTYTECCCILLLAILTVVSGLLIFELDKNYNTPLINSMFLKAISLIALICVGIFIFKEKYKMHQYIGFFLVLCGMYLISQKTLNF